MSGKEVITQVLTNTKVAATVGAGTTGTGIATVLDWIPDGIGKLAALAGIALSVALLRVHLANYKKIKLETEIMRRKEAERVEAARRRKEAGEPVRRAEDANS